MYILKSSCLLVTFMLLFQKAQLKSNAKDQESGVHEPAAKRITIPNGNRIYKALEEGSTNAPADSSDATQTKPTSETVDPAVARARMIIAIVVMGLITIFFKIVLMWVDESSGKKRKKPHKKQKKKDEKLTPSSDAEIRATKGERTPAFARRQLARSMQSKSKRSRTPKSENKLVEDEVDQEENVITETDDVDEISDPDDIDIAENSGMSVSDKSSHEEGQLSPDAYIFDEIEDIDVDESITEELLRLMAKEKKD